MLPHEREMVKRLADQPFTLLGINSDSSRSALKEILEDEEITWPNIYNGPPGQGEIANRWNVHGWPTIYILDHEGIIRHRGLRNEAMEEAVVELIRKIPG
jgi:hypothetical protein